MPAVVGIATQNIGYSEGRPIFVVISDGETTKFMMPNYTPDDIKKSILRALGARLTAFQSTDPEELVDMLVYNFPADMSVSEPMSTFEEAEKRARDYMEFVNDFEGPAELLDAITSSDEMEEEE